MKCLVAILVLCCAAVGGQSQSQVAGSRGPPPQPTPAGGPPSSMTKPAATVELKGCRPGCGPTDICVELADNYCRPGQRCSVCAKMSSIRFPTAALSGILNVPGVTKTGAQKPVVSPSGPQYYPQQGFSQRQSGSNILIPALMFGGLDMGFGF